MLFMPVIECTEAESGLFFYNDDLRSLVYKRENLARSQTLFNRKTEKLIIAKR